MGETIFIPHKQLRTLRLRKIKKYTQTYPVNQEKLQPRSSNL